MLQPPEANIVTCIVLGLSVPWLHDKGLKRALIAVSVVTRHQTCDFPTSLNTSKHSVDENWVLSSRSLTSISPVHTLSWYPQSWNIQSITSGILTATFFLSYRHLISHLHLRIQIQCPITPFRGNFTVSYWLAAYQSIYNSTNVLPGVLCST